MGDIPLPDDPTTDDVDIAAQSLSSVGVSQNQPVDISDDSSRSLGEVVIPTSNPAVGVDTSPTSSSTTATGAGSAAQIDAGGLSEVEVLYDTSGAATITVETSTDGNNWYERATFSPGGATQTAQLVTTGARYVRAYIDSNVNRLEVSAKGV